MTWNPGIIKVGKALFQVFPPNSSCVVTKWFVPCRKFGGDPAAPKQGITEPLRAWDFS